LDKTSRSDFRDFKGISLTLATIIILAVAITITLAFSYWVGGLTQVFLGFERVEVSYVEVAYDPDGWSGSGFATSEGGWNISIGLVNKGIWDSTFTDLLINGKPMEVYSGSVVLIDPEGNCYTSSKDLLIRLKAGTSMTLTVWIKAGGFEHGQIVSITLQTARGGSFLRDVILT